MNHLIYRHFDVIEQFIKDFKTAEGLYQIADRKRRRDRANYKMDLVIFNFEIYTSKYPEIYNFFLGEFQDEFKRREEWDRLRSRENFATYLKQLLNSVSMQSV
ncbi:hypothetical protein [Zunongwangia atlantica]|uniref:Uncharacterized protein n=1 Tax=Zunongwangia atlantica 22II14-10F7 TaxID=1185767 RepID=A0A1Y1T0T6_9FLAO|nr:hypothetical protein [Zunongwangia atlantica]ORL44103.1 hypothetical protein IIF7_17317 [Zunongwangia atlantica 22II14-10F7]